MKISVIGPQFPDSFANNVSATLTAMGHEVQTLDGRLHRHDSNRYAAAFRRNLPKLFPAIEAKMHARLTRALIEFHPELVLVTYDLFGPDALERIKRAAKCPVACWYIDAPANLRGGNLFLCDYDAFFVKEPALVETMRGKLALPAHYLPEACNPMWHKLVTPTAEQRAKYSCDVVAQGTAHPYRAKFFEGLLEFDVKIWGAPAPAQLRSPSRKFFQGAYLTGLDKAAALACGKVLVNSIHFVEQQGVNNTLFEAAGCGAFQICDERPTLAEFFQPGEEVVTFRDRKDLVEKVRYYLGRPEERSVIAARASKRAHRDHSYEKRLASMLQTLRLS